MSYECNERISCYRKEDRNFKANLKKKKMKVVSNQRSEKPNRSAADQDLGKAL